jgi:glycosyltransferase involved in cell wall biosynthesis
MWVRTAVAEKVPWTPKPGKRTARTAALVPFMGRKTRPGNCERSSSIMDVSIIIATANRARELTETLTSLAAVTPTGETELLIVDNNSSDQTKSVVAGMAAGYPYRIRYLFESTDGKYAALNSGIRAAEGRIIVATDDDARFERDWLERAVDGLSRYGCEFVGGRVLPLWGAPQPRWLAERNGLHAKVIALLDHGGRPREFGRSIGWPLGVNVAYRREAFERVGGFDNRLGRKSGTLRNQAQREWHLRARAVGARGFYIPEMVVHHLVPAERLQKSYFRRWLYWHGISRAVLYRNGGFDMEEPELDAPPHAGDAEVAGVPIHLVWKAARSVRSLLWHTLTGDSATAFEYELWLWFFAGLTRQRWSDRKLPVASGPAAPGHEACPPLAHRHLAKDVDLAS